MLIEGDPAGVVGLGCGLPVCYGAYLFFRAAVRVRRELRRHPLTAEQRRSRRGMVRFVLGYTAFSIVGAVGLPVPTLVRVVMGISALAVMPLLLARQFEPAKKQPRTPTT